MTMNREIDEILAEIGREHRAMEAPQRLESVLSTAARRQREPIGTPGARPWTWAAAMILLAAVAAAGLMWQARRSHEPQKQQVRSVPAPQQTPASMLPSGHHIGRSDLQAKAAARRDAQINRIGPRDSPHRTTSNSLEEFVALPVSEGLPPATEMSVVRIKLLGSDLQQYGLEAPGDAVAQPLLAEFVVGEDGLPRAIRIVR